MSEEGEQPRLKVDTKVPLDDQLAEAQREEDEYFGKGGDDRGSSGRTIEKQSELMKKRKSDEEVMAVEDK